MLDRMKTVLKSGLAVAIITTSFVTFGAPARAESADGSFQVAQNWNGGNGNWNGNWRHGWRGGGHGWNRGGWNGGGWNGGGWNGGGWNGGGWNGGGYYYHDNNNWAGAAAAAGIIGLATGAIIANSANQQRYYSGGYGGDYISYCSSRYRSFNPNTGTFTGYDGYQHRCVMP
ncbi:hypothetical protein K32_29270 [Kaistia sp. 32K]|uniref:BA14K family protein n=1 Tax=Kaistia sp. 32K TaxID=2795690 RepID=UPI001916C9BD|nr:BA14K family protein [Kaistia sp. 32K]BCP54310.1 hypothetical protein K32_29270 [Kaistia sp. 32K]